MYENTKKLTLIERKNGLLKFYDFETGYSYTAKDSPQFAELELNTDCEVMPSILTKVATPYLD